MQRGKLAAIGELAAGVAHEINNPLCAILGFVEFLLRDAEPETKAFDRLCLIQESGHEIRTIVDALLEFAREPSEDREVVELRTVVAQAVELVRQTSAAKGVELHESYCEGATPVFANASQLKQVLLNLIGNARQAMDGHGAVTLTVESHGHTVLARVSDTGPGIPAEVLPNVFDPFFTTRREQGGTGLGLSVSYGIAEAHSGNLTARSDSSGATFELRLPLAPGRPDAAGEAA
jgi:two-component system NtrC family sensor kinase